MAEFEEEIRRATLRLRELANETDRAARGTRKREDEAEQRSTFARLGALLGGGLAGLTPAANTFGATGSFDDAADVASASVVEALARNFPLLAGAAGVTKEVAARTGARGETIGLLDDLARHNVPISDEFLQKVIDIKVAQHERIEELKARVTAKTGYTAGDAAGDLGSRVLDTGPGFAVGDKLVDVLGRLADLLESMPFMGRGY